MKEKRNEMLKVHPHGKVYDPSRPHTMILETTYADYEVDVFPGKKTTAFSIFSPKHQKILIELSLDELRDLVAHIEKVEQMRQENEKHQTNQNDL